MVFSIAMGNYEKVIFSRDFSEVTCTQYLHKKKKIMRYFKYNGNYFDIEAVRDLRKP